MEQCLRSSLFFARKLAEKKPTRFPKQTLDNSIFTARIEVFTQFSDYQLGNETLTSTWAFEVGGRN